MASRIEQLSRELIDVDAPAQPLEFERALAVLGSSVADADVENDMNDSWRSAAEGQHGCDGEVEIDHDAIVSISEDGGAYVQAWVYVDGANCSVCDELCSKPPGQKAVCEDCSAEESL